MVKCSSSSRPCLRRLCCCLCAFCDLRARAGSRPVGAAAAAGAAAPPPLPPPSPCSRHRRHTHCVGTTPKVKDGDWMMILSTAPREAGYAKSGARHVFVTGGPRVVGCGGGCRWWVEPQGQRQPQPQQPVGRSRARARSHVGAKVGWRRCLVQPRRMFCGGSLRTRTSLASPNRSRDDVMRYTPHTGAHLLPAVSKRGWRWGETHVRTAAPTGEERGACWLRQHARASRASTPAHTPLTGSAKLIERRARHAPAPREGGAGSED
jgi:hypothetical protein